MESVRTAAAAVARLNPVVAFAVAAALLLAIQLASGAYQSEFTGAPDEPGHFVTALAVHDYLVTLPKGSPFEWASRYYLHYPQVGLGHWPPAYFVLNAVWWLFTGPTRLSALVLQLILALAALAVLFRALRGSLPPGPTVFALASAVAVPVFHEALGRVMSDMLCFLLGALFLQALTGLLERKPGALPRLMLVFVCAALTKGTAACLAPAPILAWLAARDRPVISRRYWLAAAVALACAAALHLAVPQAAYWGGLNSRSPWRIDTLVAMTGAGLFLLAMLGASRDPLPLAAASMVASAALVSYFVHAIRTDRHWIIILPALAALTASALVRVRPRWILAPLLALAAWFFPWRFERQAPGGLAEAAARIPRPSRMIISSSRNGEAEWIAVAAGQEKRPQSYIVRASKTLVDQGWTGKGYELLTPDAGAVLRRLDEYAIEVAVVHTPPGSKPRRHQQLLRAGLASSPAWNRCDSSQALEVYCRAAAPNAERRPLRIQVRGWTFEEPLPKLQPGPKP